MSELVSVVIVDIDGTLADHDGLRGPYEYARVGLDRPFEPIVRLVKLLAEHHGIIFVSGREDTARTDTEAWLRRHGIVEWEALHMRPAGDYRKDDLVKRELYEAHIEGRYRVELVLDDRSRVVKMWRALGLTCLQVADGDF
jgi:hypothetical protein